LRHFLIATCVLALSFLMFVWLGAVFRPTPQRAQTFPPCTWRVVPSPNLFASTRDDNLVSVSADAPNDVWAVGNSSQLREGGANRSMILHWNGSAWSLAYTLTGTARGVSADSPSDVWVVADIRGDHALGLRFDGSNWRPTSLADPGTTSWNLAAIHAVAPDDVWAVGGTADLGGSGAPLIEHWDGARWSIVPAVGVPRDEAGVPNASLTSLAVSADGTVWAVGQATSAAGSQEPLVLRGGAGGFRVVPTPSPVAGNGSDWLFGVSTSGRGVDAVGSYSSTEGYGGRGDRPLAIAWEGSAWHEDVLPDIPGSWRLFATATRGRQVFAVGSDGISVLSKGKTLVLVRSASGWSRVPAPSPAGSSLQAISVAPDGGIWAVGSRRGPGGSARTLTMHCT
jgi:hypothetical protein